MRFHRPMLYRTLPKMLSALSLAMLAAPLGAQEALPADAGGNFGAVYDAAREITFTGTVRAVVTKHRSGSPAGMHLLVSGPQGPIDAHLGPYVPQLENLLHRGSQVQVTGSMETLHGTQVLLVRQLSFAGRMVTVRSPRGFLVHANTMSAQSSGSDRNAPGNGGPR